MGATTFYASGCGKTMAEAYRGAVEDAIHENGNDAYNGTISTTQGFRDLTDRFKASGKSLKEFMDQTIDEAHKWGPAFGICIREPKGNTNKVKSSVKHNLQAGTKQWETKYVIYTGKDDEIDSADTKGEAIKIARTYTEKHTCRVFIHVEKRMKGNSLVATVEYKPSTTERVGHYEFYGWAAE